MLTTEQSKNLNQTISYIEIELTDGLNFEDLSFSQWCLDTGKLIPYIGWFWRHVDFTRPLTIGFTKTWESVLDSYPKSKIAEFIQSLEMTDSFFGFMENNKWGYWETEINTRDSNIIIKALQKAVYHKHKDNFKAAFDVIQKIGLKYYKKKTI